MAKYRADLLSIAVLTLVVFGILIFVGEFTDGPSLVDDNQILKLQIEFADHGITDVLATELHDRFFNMRRLCPVFSVQKVLQAKSFGANMVVWTTATGAIGVCTASMLYAFFRVCGGSVLASIVFALINILGQQFVLWWRLLHGEGIGMLFLALALLLVAVHSRQPRPYLNVAFCVAIALSVLSKESFILAVPAVAFLKVYLRARHDESGIVAAARNEMFPLIWLLAVFVVPLSIILLVFQTTTFNYAGYTGFDLQRFVATIGEYLRVASFWALALLLVLLFWVRRSSTSHPPRGQATKNRPTDRTQPDQSTEGAGGAFTPIAAAAVFWLLMTLPQILLNMNTGMSNTNHGHYGRYALPCMVGFAFLVAHVVDTLRNEVSARPLAKSVAWILLCVLIGERAVISIAQGRQHSIRSRIEDQWFESVVEHSTPDASIVIIFPNGMGGGFSVQRGLRVYYLLSQYYGRPNIYFCPIPPDPPLEEAVTALQQTDARRHALEIPTVNELPPGKYPDIVLIENTGLKDPQDRNVTALLYDWLRYSDTEWFDPKRYLGNQHRHGHMIFYLQDPSQSH